MSSNPIDVNVVAPSSPSPTTTAGTKPTLREKLLGSKTAKNAVIAGAAVTFAIAVVSGGASFFMASALCVAIFIAAAVLLAACVVFLFGCKMFPFKRSQNPADSLPNDVLSEAAQEILDKFLAEKIKPPEHGNEEAQQPAAIAMKEFLEDPQKRDPHMGVSILQSDSPEKIHQFFVVVGQLDESSQMAFLTSTPKVNVPWLNGGHRVPMGTFAMTHGSNEIKRDYLQLLQRLSKENLRTVLLQNVCYKGLPNDRAPLGMFIISREMDTDLRQEYLKVIEKFDFDELKDIEMDGDKWNILWSLLLFGDKNPTGTTVRDEIVAHYKLNEKENFEKLLACRPGGFSKADETTHANTNARTQLNNRMDNMLAGMNKFLATLAATLSVTYQSIQWSSN